MRFQKSFIQDWESIWIIITLIFLSTNKVSSQLCISLNYVYSNNSLLIEIDYNLLGKYKLNKLKIEKDTDFLIYPATYEIIPTELQEAMFLIAIFASRLNIAASLKVLEKVLPFYNGKYNTLTTIADIGKIALEQNKLLELQQLIDILILQKKYNEFQILMLMFLNQMRKPLPMLKEFYRQNILKVINSNVDDTFKGTLSYNLANSYRADSDKLYQSAKYYFQARRLNPDYINRSYINRSYWWYEVAGILFLTTHFKCAEEFYLKADRISDRFRPQIYALIGDTLLFQGNFPEARKWFRKYTKSKEEKDSEFHLKLICLQYFKKQFGEIKERNIKEAGKEMQKILHDNILTIPKLKEIIKTDPLCGCAWYNYAHSLLKDERKEEAFYAFLFCFICENWFPTDAAINTLFLALHLKEVVLFAQILETILFKFGDSILEDIANALKQNPSIPIDGKEFIFQQIKSMLSLVAKRGIWREQ